MLVFKNSRENAKEYWNERSKSFFQMLQNSVEEESEVILEVLKEKKIDFSNLNVLDLGCGFGRHIKFFEDIAKECVGIDISEEMIKLAKDYIKFKDKTTFHCIDWTNDDFSEKNKGKFSLVFSAMCQALDDEENIKKFISCSNKYCMVERLVKEDNPLVKLVPDIDKNRPNNDWEYSRDFINLLWNLGYYPETKVYAYDKEFMLSPKHQEYQVIMKSKNTEMLKEVENQIAKNGVYRYKRHIVKILICWSVEERRK